MRRRIALALGVVGLSLASVVAARPRRLPVDPRLIGTWRSDAERTLATWKFKPTATPEVRARIGKWFGKLTHRYTESTVYTEFEDERFSSLYWVVESGENFVAIASQNAEGIETQRIFLDSGQSIFVITRGGNIEYFKRVEA